MANGLMQLTIRKFEETKRAAAKMKKQSETVVKRTTNDFRTRGPAWVSAAVATRYNIKKADVKSALTARNPVGKLKVSGKLVDNAALLYEGKLLTITRFRMRPASRPQKRRYTVTAEIIKGQRRELGQQVFIAAGNGGQALPFQRRGTERLPIETIRTLSVPQMITHEEVATTIQENIAEGLGKRLDHHLQRELAR